MRYLSEAVGPKDSLVVLPAADQLIDFLYSIIVFLALLLYITIIIIIALCVFTILDAHPCHATLGLEVRMFTYLCYCFQPPESGKVVLMIEVCGPCRLHADYIQTTAPGSIFR